MTRQTRAEQYRSLDLAALDHLPGCPSCGDLCDPGALVCECGQRLVPNFGYRREQRAERRAAA